MEQNNIKQRTLSGLFWRFAERSGAQGIQFIVSIVLARLLTPADYGLIGLITVFTSIALVFATSSFGQALVQKHNADNKDFSSVFFFSLVFSVFIYGILFLAAPLIAGFYDEPKLTAIVRVLGLSVIVGAVNSVQQAYVQKTMQFKRFFWSTLGGTIVSAFVGIGMAYKGYGVWALVGQNLSSQIIGTLVLWFTVRWRPDFVFSIKRMGRLFSYGWKLLCSTLLDTVYNNIYSLIIGKFYTASDLGYYNRGKQFPILIIQNINTAIDSVLFPVLSEMQDQKERLKATVRRSMTTSTFIIFPCMAGLAAVAKPLTVLLLTEKWLPAVPFIRFCCFTYAFWPVHTANLQAIKALGRSDVFLKLEIVKKIMGVTILCVTLPLGLTVMMWGRCVSTLLSTFINASPNKKLMGYSYIEQIKDILPAFALSIVMACIVMTFEMLPLPALVIMLLQILAGTVIYVTGAKLFRMECFKYILNIIKNLLKNKGVSK